MYYVQRGRLTFALMQFTISGLGPNDTNSIIEQVHGALCSSAESFHVAVSNEARRGNIRKISLAYLTLCRLRKFPRNFTLRRDAWGY
jgi:hypothetical protein